MESLITIIFTLLTFITTNPQIPQDVKDKAIVVVTSAAITTPTTSACPTVVETKSAPVLGNTTSTTPPVVNKPVVNNLDTQAIQIIKSVENMHSICYGRNSENFLAKNPIQKRACELWKSGNY